MTIDFADHRARLQSPTYPYLRDSAQFFNGTAGVMRLFYRNESFIPNISLLSNSASEPLHLCQRCLCLRQPERHPHGTVQVDRSAQLRACLLLLACLGVEHA
jgi:hypothetical protein